MRFHAKIYLLSVILILTFFSCKKSEDKPDNSSNGLTPIPGGVTEAPGWKYYGYVDPVEKGKTIVLDQSGKIWIGGNKKLMEFQDTAFLNYAALNSILNPYANADVYSMIIDRNNNFWMGSDSPYSADYSSRGVIKFDGTSFTQYQEWNSSIHNDVIYSVAVDSSNNKWFGTQTALVKFDETTWSYYDSTNSPLKEFHPLLVKDNIIWVGGKNSLTKFDGSSWQVFNSTNSEFPTSGIRILKMDNAGNLWFVGFFSTVLWKFDGVNFTSYPIPVETPVNPYFGQSLGDEEYYSLKSDNYNNIWLGGYGKLVKFDGINWTKFYTPSMVLGGDPRNIVNGMRFYPVINDILIKSDSSVWVASSVFQLMRFKQ